MTGVPFPIDRYDLKARLYPGLLVTLPMFAVAFSIFPKLQHPKALGIGLVLESALLYWLMRIARDQGKRAEARLFREWGGRPTSRLLRWSDSDIDPLTKARYHRFLTKLIGVTLPDQTSEARDPSTAEQCYDSAVRALIEKRRTKTYSLIFAENCNYGFARNLYGLRWAGVASNLITGALLLGACWRREWQMSELMWGTATLAVFCTILLVVFASKASVRRAAIAYAQALLRSCETASTTRKTPAATA